MVRALDLETELAIVAKKQKESNINGEGQSLRHSSGKPRPFQLPPDVMEDILKVFEVGAEKYDLFNWKKPTPSSSTINPLDRHFNEYKKGIDVDETDNTFHLAKVAANAIMELYRSKRKGLRIDDRLEWHSKPDYGVEDLKVGKD